MEKTPCNVPVYKPKQTQLASVLLLQLFQWSLPTKFSLKPLSSNFFVVQNNDTVNTTKTQMVLYP